MASISINGITFTGAKVEVRGNEVIVDGDVIHG